MYFQNCFFPRAITAICKYICYKVLTVYDYLDHLIKLLQLPNGIIWIQLTSHSVPGIQCASHLISHLIYTLPSFTLGSWNF